MDEGVLDLARWWSWRRQRLDRSCRGVDDCLRSIVGIPNAHPSGPLSLLARVPRVMMGMYDGAIENRVALRLPAMRKGVYVLHGETAHLVHHATRPASARKNGSANAVRSAILRAARTPMTPDEISERMKDPPDRLAPTLNAMLADASLLRVKAPGAGSNTFSLVATRSWLGHGLPPADGDEALIWLAGEYLSTYGPATVADFAWWAGVAEDRAEPAMRSYDIADVGDGALMGRKDAHAFELARPVAGRVNLLPALDPYTMGYAPGPSRERFADPDLDSYLYDKAGNSTNVILIEGTVGGLWDLGQSRKALEIRVALFDDPGPKAWAAIQAETQLVAGFLDARDATVTRVKIRTPISKRGPNAALAPLKD
jgi:winged helix DNA-binding protein